MLMNMHIDKQRRNQQNSVTIMEMTGLQKTFREKLEIIKGRRTGATLRAARGSLPKAERNKIKRDVRKNGVKALATRMGIADDVAVETFMGDLIRTGEVKTTEELIARVEEYKRRSITPISTSDNEAQSHPAPTTVDLDNRQHGVDMVQDVMSAPIQSLPGANPRRKQLKAMSTRPPLAAAHTSNNLQASLQGEHCMHLA
jgi:hypothetical protein